MIPKCWNLCWIESLCCVTDVVVLLVDQKNCMPIRLMTLPGAARPAPCAASGIVLPEGGLRVRHVLENVVGLERSIAWFHRFRRLIVRYERRADIHLAFMTLAAALIAFRFC